MAKKPTITTIASGYYSRQALNTNFENLRDSFDNTLSLDGSTPNAMGADLDMNANDIINAATINTSILRIGGTAVTASNVVNDHTEYKYAFKTVADLLADTRTLTTYYTIGDYVLAGGFAYVVVASGGDVTTAGGVQLDVLVNSGGSVTPEQFGAVGDGVADDAAFLTTAAAFCVSTGATLEGKGNYSCASSVNLRYIKTNFEAATITIAHAGIGVYIGGNANNPNNPTQRFGAFTRTVGSDSTTTPSVRCIGAKGQKVHVFRCNYFQVYADTNSTVYTTDYSSAYSSFYLKYIGTIELTNNAGTDGTATQWINENQFYLNRTTNVLINGTYPHNHNHFFDGTFEVTCSINLDTGYDNFFHRMRFEAGPTTITFGGTSARNTIEKTWSSSENTSSIFDQLQTGTITDNGVQNQVYDSRGKQYFSTPIAFASTSDVVLNTTIGSVGRTATLQRVSGLSFNDSLISDFIPVVEGDQYEWIFTADDSGITPKYRTRMFFYDKDFLAVTADASWISSPSMTNVSSNSIGTGTGAFSGVARITGAGAAGAVYLRCSIYSGSGDQVNAHARVVQINRRSKYTLPSTINPQEMSKVNAVSAIPTQGFAPIGYTAVDTDGLSLYINTFALNTSLSSAAASAATVIAVTSGTGTVNGDVVGINLDNGDTHWTTIASGGGTTSLTLTTGLAAAAAIGSRVVFNRWVTK